MLNCRESREAAPAYAGNCMQGTGDLLLLGSPKGCILVRRAIARCDIVTRAGAEEGAQVKAA